MTGQTYVYVAWAAGAVATFAWFAVRHVRDPERFSRLIKEYPLLPDTSAFAWTTYALAATIWPAVEVGVVVKAIREQRRSER